MEQRIRQIRKHFRLTQVEFGERIGLKGNTITTYETGIRAPSESVLMAICREFGVNRSWLDTGIGDMFDISEQLELDRIAAQYSQDPTFRAILDVYSRLSDDARRTFEQIVEDLAEEIQRRRNQVTVAELEANADQTEAGLTGGDDAQTI